MKQKIDLTNWREVVDYMVFQSNFDWKTEEHFIKDLQEDMISEINWLWSEDQLNINHWDNSIWNDELNKEHKKYFELKNEFNKNANVDKEDHSLTRYELIKKYGQDWYDENYVGATYSIKNNLSIDQLESLTSLMKEGYYDFWSYEIDEKGFIFPYFRQYSTEKYSEYMNAKRRFENFEVEVNQQKSSKTQKLAM